MFDLAAAPLGVFDSGVGGITVLNALIRALPDENFIYLGDSARVPYGSKPLPMVRAFAHEISEELLGRGVKGIVVACNTASAASLPALADSLPVPVWGVVEPGVQAALRRAQAASGSSRVGRVGVLGTVGTIQARVYQERLEATGLETWARACPLFVPIVEEGVSDTAIARLVAEHYLSDRPALDAVILGCTHYPALKETLKGVLGGDVALVDSAEETAAAVTRDLEIMGLTRGGGGRGTVQHLTTGDPASYRHTAERLGGPIPGVERLTFPLATIPSPPHPHPAGTSP